MERPRPSDTSEPVARSKTGAPERRACRQGPRAESSIFGVSIWEQCCRQSWLYQNLAFRHPKNLGYSDLVPQGVQKSGFLYGGRVRRFGPPRTRNFDTYGSSGPLAEPRRVETAARPVVSRRFLAWSQVCHTREGSPQAGRMWRAGEGPLARRPRPTPTATGPRPFGSAPRTHSQPHHHIPRLDQVRCGDRSCRREGWARARSSGGTRHFRSGREARGAKNPSPRTTPSQQTTRTPSQPP